jgi:hypothetical protein
MCHKRQIVRVSPGNIYLTLLTHFKVEELTIIICAIRFGNVTTSRVHVEQRKPHITNRSFSEAPLFQWSVTGGILLAAVNLVPNSL